MNDSLVTLRQTPFSDFEALRDAAQDAPSEIVQLEPGPIAGNLMHLAVGTVGISTGKFSRAIRGRGILSQRRWALGFFHNPGVVFQHFELRRGDSYLVAPGQEHFAVCSSANGYTQVFIEPPELFAYLESQQPGAAETAVLQRQSAFALALDPDTAAAKVKQMSMLVDVLATHGPRLSAGTADFYRRNILDLKTASLRKAVNYRGAPVRSAADLVRKVDRFLADAGPRPVHVGELCAVFDVPRRTLHRAFDDVLGMPPIAFLRRKRLSDVHAALLLTTGGPDVLIKDIAIEHGFVELGRFAAEYRRMFSELPSQTLARSLS